MYVSCDRTFKLDIISISLRRNNVLLYGNIELITLKVVFVFCLKAATRFDLFSPLNNNSIYY